MRDSVIEDLNDYLDRQDQQEKEAIKCDHCGMPIYLYYYEIGGECICDDCMSQYKKWVD